jgi:hypothetical protein
MYCNHSSVNGILQLIVLSGILSFSFILFLPFLGYLYAALQINPVMICLLTTMDNDNKHQEISIVIALIAAASLLSLGAVAATTITPAFAGGDDDGDEVKQKAKAKNNCRVNEAEDNERAFVEQGQQGGGPTDCIAVSANINDAEVILGGLGLLSSP